MVRTNLKTEQKQDLFFFQKRVIRKLLQDRVNVLIFITLTVVLLFNASNSILLSAEKDSKETETVFRRGKSIVTLRLFPEESGLTSKNNFNHPYFFKKSTLVDILSSINYIDKDIMKTMLKRDKSKGKRVFQSDEIETLVPLIIEAFSKATPEQDVLVSSFSERFLLEGLNNVFSLFMTGDSLNIVFGKIRHRGDVSKSQVVNVRNLERNVEPLKVTESHFWEVTATPGQMLKSGHKNWLIIDFQNESFELAVKERKEVAAKKYTDNFKPIVDPLEDRIKKLEEVLAKSQTEQKPIKTEETLPHSSQTDEQQPKTKETLPLLDLLDENQPANPPQINNNVKLKPNNDKEIDLLKEKFSALRELLQEDLITYKDYEQKKSDLLDEFKFLDVKASLKELKNLKEMGFITEADFENIKKEMLENL